MASRTVEPQVRPEPGQILVVIHDFSARSSDELSLAKGDRVELIERDDDFGDGWYLGRHLNKGNSGLFPEVYTRIAPRGSLLCLQNSPLTDQKLDLTSKAPNSQNIQRSLSPTPASGRPTASDSVKVAVNSESNDLSITSNIETQVSSVSSCSPAVAIYSEGANKLQKTSIIDSPQKHGQDSPVMNETLSVINEHITNLNSSQENALNGDKQANSDSGSEYSSHAEPRLSYIQGEETDEDEDEVIYTREQVTMWSPEQVSEHLFIIGVEPKHCEVLLDQEITGDVLLGMDQTSIFLKEFDFGSVGRRLKTWQKIKFLQDEVKRNSIIKNTGVRSSELVEDFNRHRSRSSSSFATLPKSITTHDRQNLSFSSAPTQQKSAKNDNAVIPPNFSGKISSEDAHTMGEIDKVSNARQKYHSQQNSLHDSNQVISLGPVTNKSSANSRVDYHNRQASFDKDWKMENSATPARPNRYITSEVKAAPRTSTRTSLENQRTSKHTASSTIELLESGYFSVGETDGVVRNFPRKREVTGIQTTIHSRNSSYTDEHRMRVSSAQKSQKNHNRFGSVDSTREVSSNSAAAKYYGLSGISGRRRMTSESSKTLVTGTPPKDSISLTSPAVTKLEGESFVRPVKSNDVRHGKGDFLTTMKSASSGRFGLRAISDAVTGHEKLRANHPPDATLPTSSKYSPTESSLGTGTSTPSGGQSFDFDSSGIKSASSLSTSNSNGRIKKKSKQETSAYTRGLERKTPKEAIALADYSGWMKKKSTNLMASWKPRLFILKGRRLSYYYSEDDDGERGLIDISFHRVLPADNDRLTGIHAALTGASANSNMNASANAKDSTTEPEFSFMKGTESMFIFKLVPPRAGLQRAVTFTKPTVHYFAVPNVQHGRLWMAALMKATIERDDSAPLKSTYQQQTISLTKARALRHRPPALMNVNEQADEEAVEDQQGYGNDSLDISGIVYSIEPRKGDSGVSGVSKLDTKARDMVRNGHLMVPERTGDELLQPNTA